MQFHCGRCTLEFEFQYQLIMHRYSHKPVKKPTEAGENKENSCCHSCDLCDLVFINEDHLKNHVSQHVKVQRFVCGLCKTSFKTETRYIHHITDPTVHLYKNQCSLCSKILASKSTLRKHIKMHTRETKFHCKICKKPFLTQKKLHAHETTHSPEYRCKVCQEDFKSKLSLTQHYRSIHAKSAAFQCNRCQKSYSKEGHLKLHYLIHEPNAALTQSYQFRCNECQKSYRTKENLAFHSRTHKKTVLISLCSN